MYLSFLFLKKCKVLLSNSELSWDFFRVPNLKFYWCTNSTCVTRGRDRSTFQFDYTHSTQEKQTPRPYWQKSLVFLVILLYRIFHWVFTRTAMATSPKRSQKALFIVTAIKTNTSSVIYSFVIICIIATTALAFGIPSPIIRTSCSSSFSTTTNRSAQKETKNNDEETQTTNENAILSFAKSLVDLFENFDDVMDDFMNKRMGNGELFYGKRKYKPSGKISGQYNGFGLSDKGRIEGVQFYKELRIQNRTKQQPQEEYEYDDD